MYRYRILWLLLFLIAGNLLSFAQGQQRVVISLNNGWKTIADDKDSNAYKGFEQPDYLTKKWELVSVPHNWDVYEGFRRMKHGNRHGYSWYRKTFIVQSARPGKRYFLFFEGVGSYANIYLNGQKVGYHAGGRTTFTIDITNAIQFGKENILAVRADHPAFIKDLPWVCGGCSDEIGFSEGAQPMGIFRPVSLVITNSIRINPFGIHIWNDTTVSEREANLFLETTVTNYHASSQKILIQQLLLDQQQHIVANCVNEHIIQGSSTISVSQSLALLKQVHLWNLQNPYLYTLVTRIIEAGKTVDEIKTPYGIRWIKWPSVGDKSNNCFLLNGEKIFINGTAEYEHLLGKSQAFEKEEITARMQQVKAAGFNAFRDAHQPHNLLYQQYCNEMGLLWWPQFSAHIWYNTNAFQQQFKSLLRDWVIERRNEPSNILWGLQNESVLPEAFAKECAAMIRQLDPTASSQRKITTCNGGSGTDWNVPQNWSGTYGGDINKYDSELEKELLVGEYGAWRSIGLHSDSITIEAGYTEEKMNAILERKIQLAESVKDSVCGQFNWLLYSHENPGRAQSGEGFREIDRIGPVNYKGLFTIWGEPTDAFYLYRSNYVSAKKEPMVYIVSHTWPDRWMKAGKQKNIVVYSNCDEVELMNDIGSHSFGKQKRKDTGSHFEWNDVGIRYNVLYAVGYMNGKIVAKDTVVLHHLPTAPSILSLQKYSSKDVLQPLEGRHYLYRVNCGGPAFVDTYGNQWNADVHRDGTQLWGYNSWADQFSGINPAFASQGYRYSMIAGTKNPQLFQTYRYGMKELKYTFPLKNGTYWVDLFFSEPWYGIGGSMNCSGWRLFDIAMNDSIVVHDLDIWKAVGYNHALKKTFRVNIKGGELVISFPDVRSGEAIISGIAISSEQKDAVTAYSSSSLISSLQCDSVIRQSSIRSWLNTGDQQFSNDHTSFSFLPSELYGAEWLQLPKPFAVTNGISLCSFSVKKKADLYLAVADSCSFLKDFVPANSVIKNNENSSCSLFVRHLLKGDKVNIILKKGELSPALLAIVPSVDIDPAYDLYPSISYKIDKAFYKTTGIAKDSADGKSCIVIKQDKGDTISWKIKVGVGKKYALRFRYQNDVAQVLQMHLRLLTSDGSILHESEVQFTPYIKHKWGVVQSSTGVALNAGAYIVQCVSVQARGLRLSVLEVQ